jgi:hypothetical protein
MSEYKKISKSQAKVIKHLLNCVTSDSARPLLTCIHIDKENGYMCSADGFLGTLMKYWGSGLADIFPESGTFCVQLGKIGKDNIVEISPYEYNNQLKYPDLTAITHPATPKPAISFGINKHFLARLLQQADHMVVIHVWDSKQTIEFQYSVDGVATYSMLMPINISSDSNMVSRWHPRGQVPKE